jgi:hypothetical protein
MIESPTPTPNWPLAKALYLQNLPRPTIVEQANVNLNTLKSRIAKEKWAEERTKLQAKLHPAQNDASGHMPLSVNDGVESITRIGQSVRLILAKAAQKGLAGLDTMKAPKSLKARREWAETLKAFTDPGKVIFPWEDQKPALLIDLNTLRKVRLPGEPKPIEIASQVVAVQANPPNLHIAPESPPKTDEAGPGNASAGQ